MYIVGKCRLKILLDERKMTQSELARRLNITPQQIYNYTSNKRIMAMSVAKNIASILQCSIDDLYDWIFVDTEE